MTMPNKTPASVPSTFQPSLAKRTHDWAHTAKLLCCRVDPSGKHVFAGAIDNTIQRWEIATGRQTALVGHENWVRTLNLSQDGLTLHSGAYDGRWIAWDLAADTPRQIRSVQAHQGWLRGLAVSHDGRRVITCGNDKLVKVWSTADGQLIRTFSGHPNIPYCVQFIPGSYDLVSGDIVGNIIHWRAEDDSQVRQFDLHDIVSHVGDIAPFGGVINMCFSPDGQRLTACGLHKVSNAPAGNRRVVAVSFQWDTGEKLPKQECLKKDLDATMWRSLYHPGGTMIGIVAKEVGFWNPGANDVFHLVETPSEIFDCDLHPNGIDLFTAHFDGHVRCLHCAAE